MSWTQVHVAGINRDLLLDDDGLESALNELFRLSETTDWAGEGTSTFKRLPNNQLRGYGFLSFLSASGAATAIQNIQGVTCNLGILHAELSQPNKGKAKQKSQGNATSDGDNNTDVRLRRKRAPPAGKHPVKTSSNVAKLYRG
jgi:hypothetical protein